MATPAFIQGLTAEAGNSDTTAERILRWMRQADLIPPGSRNGGPYWEPVHYTNFLLACTSLQPIDAPGLVRSYAACEYMCSPGEGEVDQKPRRGPGTFGEILTGMIEEIARNMEAEEKAGKDHRWGVNIREFPAWLSFCHNPLKVELIWVAYSGRQARVDVYAPRPVASNDQSSNLPPWRRSAITRTAVMPIALVSGAAQAWLDTLRHREASLTFPPSGSAPANAPPENENAGDLCHKVPASSTKQRRANGAELSDHPRANGSGGLKGLPEGICEKKDFQGCAQAAAVTPS